MGKLHTFVLGAGKILRSWRLELWMAVVFSILFFLATLTTNATPKIAWIAFLLYVCLVMLHQWAKIEKDREIHALQADVQTNIARLKQLLGRAHAMHRMLIRQREGVARASQQVEKSRAEVLAMSDLKNKFIATLSHELRTPVAAIQECVNLLSDGIAGSLQPKQKDFMDIARRNVERLTALLNEILDLSKLESGGMRMYLAKVPLQEMVLEAINRVMPKAQKKGVQLTMDTKWHLPAVLVDRVHMVQVLENLLDNAVKFTPAGGKAGISARMLPSSQIEVCIWDTGRGIAKERAEKLLGGSKELDVKEDFTAPGAGLGLAICKEIVTQLGGSIWVESRVGEGSKFCFTLLAHSPGTLLQTYFQNALREASMKNAYLLYLAVHVSGYGSLRSRYGDLAAEELLMDVQRVVAGSFRMEDRIVVESSEGKIHVLMVCASEDMRERVKRLDESLRGKAFFTGNDPLDLQFLYALARCPHDGEDLDSLRKKIDAQFRMGGLDIMDLPLGGVA